MKLTNQLFTPCQWTVHPLKGGAGLVDIDAEAWGLGAVTPKTKTFRAPRR